MFICIYIERERAKEAYILLCFLCFVYNQATKEDHFAKRKVSKFQECLYKTDLKKKNFTLSCYITTITVYIR